eukprot:CAMPEP_0174376368 /NCGR_PEP_ID=MMETSP0811_2-20130205/117976_1 /TAXON_ID=73025 ORGANISM="Eutreptiella gymnastica-like, Strain CCMP1594" /NCGR_SAMPLE_ID=MMETSP0811_2 /ASSEMBLY_ACC=CAM_ASM_000667 /LENGTH=59 /DNA_ID=CAMNT_0015527497 /DNA_START=1 /DNA_END=177 /DNA_ORIENTATION=-
MHADHCIATAMRGLAQGIVFTQLVQSRALKIVLGKRPSDSYDTLDPWQDYGTSPGPGSG